MTTEEHDITTKEYQALEDSINEWLSKETDATEKFHQYTALKNNVFTIRPKYYIIGFVILFIVALIIRIKGW